MTFESLGVGDTVTILAQYIVTEADILAGSVTNTATAEANPIDDPDGGTQTPSGEDEVTTGDEDDPDNPPAIEDPNGHLTINKVTTSTPANGTAYALGETITYSITAVNDGNLTITDITVTDELTGDEWTIASLAPGKSESFTATYTVTETDILDGEVVNVATAEGTSPDPKVPDVPVEPGTDPEPTVEKDGHLTINKVTTSTPANGEAYALGEKITYSITATNDGNLTITDITVSDELTGDEWTIASLAPGKSESFTAEYTVTETDILDGEVVNVATAKGTSPDPDEPEVPVEPGTDPEPTVEKDGHLTIDKTTTSQTPAGGYTLGATITYQITATNDGNLTLRNVTVTDELTGDEWTIASLAPGASQNFTTSFVVTEADVLAGQVLNVATAKGTSPDPDEPEVPVTPGEDPEPTVTPNDAMTVVKNVVSTPANGTTYGTGETVRYTIVVTNTGNMTLSNVQVSDQMTGATGMPVVVAGAGYTVAGTVATIASLAPGATVTIPVNYTVLVTDAGASITNAAIASGTSPNAPNGPTTDNDTTDPVNVTPAPTPAPATVTPATPAAAVPAAIVPAAAAVAPTPAAPAATPIADNPTPQVQTINDDGNALGEGEGSWSLFDLIATIVTTILAAIMLVFAFGRNRKDGEEDEQTGEQEPDEVYKRKRLGRVLSVVPAVGAIVLFVLTQDLTQPMAIFDSWSLVFGIIGIVNIVLAIVTRKTTKDGDDEQQQTPQSGFVPAGPASL